MQIFDNELEYKVMYPFALTADNMLFIINLLLKTYKHLIVYLIKIPASFNQKIIKSFFQKEYGMYHFRGSMLYVDNSSFPYNDIAINKESRLSNFSSISNFSITSKNKNNTNINVNNNTNDDSAIYLLTKK